MRTNFPRITESGLAVSESSQGQRLLQDKVARWGLWFALLNIIDGFQTMLVVSRYGVGAEINPWLGWWIANYSFAGLWMVKLSIMAVVLFALRYLSLSVLRAVSLGLAIIVASNFVTLLSRF